MGTQRLASDEALEQYGNQTVVATSRYSFKELADIYNQTRVDYIVPMPMNARRMEEYVRDYDIDLDASFVSLNTDSEPTGVGMLGIRDDRAWITRLGVIPHGRGRKTGLFLMDVMLAEARSRKSRLVQLEVIKGNEPAYRLFSKLGFLETRELLVSRRPPAAPVANPQFDSAEVTPLTDDEITTRLQQYDAGASWVEEGKSILQAGSLKGFEVTLTTGAKGWLIFQNKAFQIAHIVLGEPDKLSAEMAQALLYHLHRQYPQKDTSVENIAVDSRFWPAYQSLGYMESFRRIEMFLMF